MTAPEDSLVKRLVEGLVNRISSHLQALNPGLQLH